MVAEIAYPFLSSMMTMSVFLPVLHSSLKVQSRPMQNAVCLNSYLT